MLSKQAGIRALSLCLFLCLVAACEQPNTELLFTGSTMGTEYRVTVINTQGNDHSIELLEEKIKAVLDDVNQSMSTYLPSSEISRFNKMSGGESLILSQMAYEVMKESLQLSEYSGGAFDVTLGKAIRLWGFSEDGKINKKPDLGTLAKLRQSIGFQHLSLKGYELTKLVDGLEVNVSAIAKGYAIDKVADVLEQQGYTDFLVDVGGELRANGSNGAGQRWKIGIEKPHIMGGVAGVVELHSQAIATSGDYRNYHIIDGDQFSHTIDSQTLQPIYHKLASVSVLADKASTADGVATALMAMGEVQGVKFAEQHDIAAYFIIRGELKGEFAMHVTEAFKPNLLE